MGLDRKAFLELYGEKKFKSWPSILSQAKFGRRSNGGRQRCFFVILYHTTTDGSLDKVLLMTACIMRYDMDGNYRSSVWF